MGVLEELKALDKQRSKLLEGAKAEALEKADKAIEELNDLGFHYSLVEGSAAKGKRATGIKRAMKDEACPICKFKTEPLHDGRAHRSQEKKKPFTAAELKERELVKVD
jgi:hypothetical protein